MLRRLFTFSFLITSLVLLSQTGPAGVGTSASNVFWLKADAGTTSTVNGTPISAWNDQSGNAVNMTQTTSALQPSFATNIMNGFPAVQFDNVSNTNDKMMGPDSPILDNTAGYTFFTVSRPQTLGDARVIVSKRTTVSVDQSFMLFYYTGNKFHVDIQTTNDRYSTNTTYSVNNNYIIDVVYDGTLSAANRSKTYNEQSLDITATESSSFVPDNASPIILGSTDQGDGRPYGGYISEVIIYREALTTAPKIIVDNYLSAKYNIPLSANDKYAGDNAGNGDYDREVAGVGRESTGSNLSFSPSISGGIGISVNSGLDNGDYILAGHASLANNQVTTDVGGMTGVNNARWLRIWYVDVTNTLTAINTSVQFDMSDGGVGNFILGTPANYVLLYRPAQAGSWSEVAVATSTVGDRVLFGSYTFTADGYYTIGTKNYNVSPLPAELSRFSAKAVGEQVDVNWSALSKDMKFFTVEKTKNGSDYEAVATVKAQNIPATVDYSISDPQPFTGLSYYRLVQTGNTGEVSYSDPVMVHFSGIKQLSVNVFPNPSDGLVHITINGNRHQQALLEMIDATGRKLYSENYSSENEEYTVTPFKELALAPGIYLVTVQVNGKTSATRLVIK